MIRAAIYARFSSDRQNDRSVDDQIASCRELCAREGFSVVLTFCDREISGASTVNRPGFQDLMRAAEALRFDVIVAEDVDRISRDQCDWHTARKRLACRAHRDRRRRIDRGCRRASWHAAHDGEAISRSCRVPPCASAYPSGDRPIPPECAGGHYLQISPE